MIFHLTALNYQQRIFSALKKFWILKREDCSKFSMFTSSYSWKYFTLVSHYHLLCDIVHCCPVSVLIDGRNTKSTASLLIFFNDYVCHLVFQQISLIHLQ